MKKILLTLLAVLVSASVAFGASTKVSELTETQTLTDDDLFLVSTYLTGNYTSKFIKTSYLKTILQPIDVELTALAGLTSAANAIPYFTGSGTAGVISSSANMVSLLGSADYATALSNLGGQPLNDDLTTLAGGGTAGCVWGEKSDASGIECKTSINLQIDDSAAQFKSATASKGTLKVLLSGSTDSTLMTLASAQTDNRTLTLPDATGTIALVKTEKLAVFNIPGT